MVDAGIQSPGIHVLFGLDQQNVGRTLNDHLYGHFSIAWVAHDVTSLLNQWTAEGSALCLLPSSINARDSAKALREG
jgi:MinD-like ATPase involved in chromosome partitioning or flagellar assembly